MSTSESPSADGRVTALGNQLVEIHLRLREQLAALREDPDGRPLDDLRTHCLAFCSVLTRHHTGEDGGAFVALAAQFPDLRPVLDELKRDHETVAGILRRLTELRIEPTAPSLRSELDTLAALLESHFVYEEKKLVSALNRLEPIGSAAELLGMATGDRT